MRGYSSADIVTSGVEKWGCDERTMKRYIADAYEGFKEATGEQLETRRSFHIETRMKLYRDVTEKQKPGSAGVALEILKDVAKLEGLYVEKHEIRTEEVAVTLKLS